jgi:hypothetical protein
VRRAFSLAFQGGNFFKFRSQLPIAQWNDSHIWRDVFAKGLCGSKDGSGEAQALTAETDAQGTIP